MARHYFIQYNLTPFVGYYKKMFHCTLFYEQNGHNFVTEPFKTLYYILKFLKQSVKWLPGGKEAWVWSLPPSSSDDIRNAWTCTHVRLHVVIACCITESTLNHYFCNVLITCRRRYRMISYCYPILGGDINTSLH